MNLIDKIIEESVYDYIAATKAAEFLEKRLEESKIFSNVKVEVTTRENNEPKVVAYATRLIPAEEVDVTLKVDKNKIDVTFNAN